VLEESASGFRNALRCRKGIGALEHIDSKPQMDHRSHIVVQYQSQGDVVE
jgi:hypothetical protein